MSDALAAQTDDPFADAEAEFSQAGHDPFDEQSGASDSSSEVTQEPVPGRPVVDAEGKPVDPSSGPSQPIASGSGESGTDAASQQGEDPTGAAASAAAPDPAGTAPGARDSSSTEGEMDPPQADPAPTDGDQAAPIAEATELPEERRDKNNKVTHRKYLIFRQVGQEKWEQLSWYEDADGKLVPKGTEGATRRNACLVRSRDDALAIGYAAMGAPPEGIGLVAVTGGVFAERVVKPAPIQPTRSRLTIS